VDYLSILFMQNFLNDKFSCITHSKCYYCVVIIAKIKEQKLKKLLLLLMASATSLFSYNFSGTWVNTSVSKYNDPVKLKISGNNVTPFIKRGQRVYKLKQKSATNIGNVELYEAWGFGYKNLVLVIKPINRNKIKVVEKKIDTNKKIVVTRSFVFQNKSRAIVKPIKRRFVGNWSGGNRFSALSRLNIKMDNGKVLVSGWRPTNRGDKYMGSTIATLKGGKLYTNWRKGNLAVSATITGYNYNSQTNRYDKLKVDIKAKNVYNGLTNWQTLYLVKNRPNIAKPMVRHFKIGPVDINLLTNSY